MPQWELALHSWTLDCWASEMRAFCGSESPGVGVGSSSCGCEFYLLSTSRRINLKRTAPPGPSAQAPPVSRHTENKNQILKALSLQGPAWPPSTAWPLSPRPQPWRQC